MKTVLIALLLASPVWAKSQPAKTYDIASSHSSIEFKVKHLLTYVKGTFDKFTGEVTGDVNNLKSITLKADIDAASINTRNEKRDKHLRNPDFFDVEKFPSIQFVSKSIKKVKGKKAQAHGHLTMHGVSKPVILDIEYLGTASDPWGNTSAAFTGKTSINRKDFGLAYNTVLETGGLLIGETVDIELNIEAQVKEAAKKEMKKAPKKTTVDMKEVHKKTLSK